MSRPRPWWGIGGWRDLRRASLGDGLLVWWVADVWAPACLGSVNRLRELGVRGVCGAAHESDPFLQIRFSHSTVKGKSVMKGSNGSR